MGRNKKPVGEGTVRTTISLPTELKEQMDSAPGADTVNWSAVAADAFRRKVRELHVSAKGEAMTDVIERMRAEAGVYTDRQYQAGQKAGDTWVRKHAAYDQLRRFATEVARFRSVREYIDVIRNPMNKGTALGIYHDLGGEGRRCKGFWEDEVGLGDEWEGLAGDDVFAEGFVERVIEMWDVIEQEV